MRSKTPTTEFTEELIYFGYTLSKPGPKIASAMMRRTSKKEKLVRPLHFMPTFRVDF